MSRLSDIDHPRPASIFLSSSSMGFDTSRGLVCEDEAIHHVLTDRSCALSEYEPEPFRAFGREPGSYVAQTLPRVVLTAQTGRWETGDLAMRRRGTIPADDEVR